MHDGVTSTAIHPTEELYCRKQFEFVCLSIVAKDPHIDQSDVWANTLEFSGSLRKRPALLVGRVLVDPVTTQDSSNVRSVIVLWNSRAFIAKDGL